MDSLQIREELKKLEGGWGARPIFVVRGAGSKRFVVVRCFIDINSPGGPVFLVVEPESERKKAG